MNFGREQNEIYSPDILMYTEDFAYTIVSCLAFFPPHQQTESVFKARLQSEFTVNSFNGKVEKAGFIYLFIYLAQQQGLSRFALDT